MTLSRPAHHSPSSTSLRWPALGLVLCAACAAPEAPEQAPPVEDEKPLLDVDARAINAVPHQLVVRGGHAAAQRAAEQLGGRVLADLEGSAWHLVELPADVSVLEGIRQLGDADADVFAEPNYLYAPTLVEPPRFGEQWAMENLGNFQLFGTQGIADVDINAPEAWGTNQTPGAGGVLGLIDSGAHLDHPALTGSLWTNPGEVIDGNDTDGNGYVDDLNGWATYDLPIDTGREHGTAVGTMMVGYGDVAGVAPGAELATCVPFELGFFGSPTGYYTSWGLVQCLDYFLTLRMAGVNVLATNNSYASRSRSEAVEAAITAHRDAGILFVAAAGNDGYDNDERPLFPASFDLANVISVGAVDHRGQAPAYPANKSSNYGEHSVDLMAPGHGVLTAVGEDAYDFQSGTSFAAPLVTGAVALLLEADPTLTMTEARNLLIASGKAVTGAEDSVSGRMLRLSDPGAGGALDCVSSSVSGRIAPTTKQVFYTQPGQSVTLRYLAIDCEAPSTTAVNVNAPNATVPLFDNGAGVDEIAGDGIFSGSYTPPDGGDHALGFPDGDELVVHAGPVIREGESVSYAPETLSNPTEIVELTGQLDAVKTVDLPFDVSFNGSAYDKISISTHGTAVLGTSSFGAYFNTDLSGTTLPNALFAPYWDDLDLRPIGTDPAGQVLTETLGASPNRRFVIEWHEARHYSRSGDDVTVQLVFYEDDSQYMFHYVDTDHATAAWDFGASATVGIRGHGYYQLVHSFNAPSVPGGTSLRFEVVAPWQNPANVYDATDDGFVSARDALVIINRLNSTGAGPVPSLAVEQPPFYYDVSGDNVISALDALRVINELNRMHTEGEPLSVVDTQRPWQEHEDGILYTGLGWHYAMGYHFTPEVDGTIDSLGAFVTGTKTIKLFEKDSGALLASTTVTGANDWAWESIPLTDVEAGTTYTVAVYLAGSGGSYRYLVGDEVFPRSHGGITIEGSTYAYTASAPDARPTNTITTRMYGQADVGFMADDSVALPQ